MSFKALTESQIVANLINTYTSLVTTSDDMNSGSVLRSTFEAFAQELKRLYQNMQESAAEVQKTAAYTMFGFPLNPATAAYTMQTITVTQAPITDTVIPAGTTVAVPNTNIQYKTPASATFPAGQTSTTVRVVCTQLGSIGNKLANTITQLVTPITGLTGVTVTNAQDIRNGSDLETNDQRTNRFQQWVNSLHRGDLRALLYGSKTAQLVDNYGYINEQVTKSQVVEGSGLNTIYVDNGYYTTSTALVTQCQQVINGYTDSAGNIVIGYKGAGIPSTVVKATIQSVTLSVKVAPQAGYTFAMIQASVANSLTALVQSLDVGQVLTLAAINVAIGTTPGVSNFSIVGPVADTTPANGTLLKLSAPPTVTTLP